ncbi:hypothetical protein [Butyrivibrio sp. VCB2006]|uniref:hypothetical protein n=1 Tax=Butyrivibrio sp. VCB2006 TaxID=1280679 RepID=UPI0004165209|nr:hypothetical protein [Butyrivibrio sp. VCB2006]
MYKKYEALSPEEFAKVFKKKYFSCVIIYALVMFAFIAAGLAIVFSNPYSWLVEHFTGTLVTILLICTFVLIIRISLVAYSLQNIIVSQCDPQKFIDVIEILEKNFTFRNIRKSHYIFYIPALIDLEKYDEATDYITKITTHKDSAYRRLTLVYFKAVIAYRLEKFDEFKAYHQEFKDIYGVGKMAGFQQKNANMYLELLECMQNILDENYDKPVTVYQKYMEKDKTKRAQITYSNGIAKIMDKKGDLAGALIYYDKVVTLGADAKLPIISRAKERHQELVEIVNGKKEG